jgi:hypothetical protein
MAKGRRLARWVLGVGLGLALAACDEGSETGAECTPDSPHTWESFGETFMTAYCVPCHRKYADVERVRREAGAIELEAGAGPNAVNTSMPEAGDKPTLAEREALATWLACGAP